MTTKRSKATPSVAAATLAQAFKVKTLNCPHYTNSGLHLHFCFRVYISTITGTSSVTSLCTKYFILNEFYKYFPAFIPNSQNFCASCSSKLVHWQGPKMFTHRVPMPPSQQPVKLNPRGKLQQAPSLSRNGRKQHRLFHLIQHPKIKLNRPMHLNRQLIRLTKARHRSSILRKQLSLLLKVKC